MTGFQPYANSSKPYTRWWWFSGRINEDDIRAQLIGLHTGSPFLAGA